MIFDGEGQVRYCGTCKTRVMEGECVCTASPDEHQVMLSGPGPVYGAGPWQMAVIMLAPGCTLCERSDRPMVGFVLHSGAPVCGECIKKFGP